MIARSTAIALAACLLTAAFSVATADARYDSTFQDKGTLTLPALAGVYGQVAQTCDISNNRLNIAGRFGYNSPGLPVDWSPSWRLATTSVTLRPSQPVKMGVADVAWHNQRIPTGHVVLDQDFDSQGGFAYVTRSPKKALRSKLKLFRILVNGHRDAVFGHRGYISITIPGFDDLRPAGFRVIALPDSKVQVIAQTRDTQVLLRYTRSGRPDKSWGNSGVVELPAPNSTGATPLSAVDSATTTPDGGLLISAHSAPGRPAGAPLGILKLTARGNIDTTWADGGFWTPPVPKTSYTNPGQSLLTAIRRGGGYAVLYADEAQGAVGTRSDLKLAYVDQTTGVTTLFNEKAGTYDNGGDGGFPDANPWILRESSSGPVVALAQSFYGASGGTYIGSVKRFSADADTPEFSTPISQKGFATGAFAVDPKARMLYACGADGVTPSSAKHVQQREQRKNVAVRRIKL